MRNKICKNISTFLLMIFSSLFVPSCKNHETHDEMAGTDEYYTCSMDPQVIENKAGNCPICQMKLIKVKKNNLKAGQIKLSAQQIKLANISYDTLSTHALTKEIILNGKITFDQNLSEAINSKVQGRIELLNVKSIGDYISKGQLLYEIFSEELNVAQEEYLLALQQNNKSEGLIEISKNKLLLLGMNEIQINKLKISKQIFQNVPVYANTEGFIAEINIITGNYVTNGTTLFRIASLNSIWVEAQVYLSYLPFLKLGTAANFSIPAASEQIFTGNVIFIDPQVQSPQRFVLARFQINNPIQQIKPGMMASIVLQTEIKTSFALPVDAIIQDSKGSNVWILLSNGVFENKMVTVGMQNSKIIEITSGLSEGDVVVVTGAYLLNSEYVFKKGANPMEGMKM